MGITIVLLSSLSTLLYRGVTEQKRHPGLTTLFSHVLPKDDLENVPTGYFIRNDRLMNKWRLPHTPASEDWSIVHKVELPKRSRTEIMRSAHETPLGDHLDINKTYNRIAKQFYKPGIRKNVSEHCRICHT